MHHVNEANLQITYQESKSLNEFYETARAGASVWKPTPGIPSPSAAKPAPAPAPLYNLPRPDGGPHPDVGNSENFLSDLQYMALGAILGVLGTLLYWQCARF